MFRLKQSKSCFLCITWSELSVPCGRKTHTAIVLCRHIPLLCNLTSVIWASSLSLASLTFCPPSSARRLRCQLSSWSQLLSRLPRWTFNAVGEFDMDCKKNHRPLTVPCGSHPPRQEWAKKKKREQKGKWAPYANAERKTSCIQAPLCFHCTRRPKVTINIHCCRWVGLCSKAHWTMSATVAQFCLTRNLSQSADRMWSTLISLFIYFLFFTFIFFPLFLPPQCWELKGKSEIDTNRLLASCLSSSSSPLIDGYVCSKGEGSAVNV